MEGMHETRFSLEQSHAQQWQESNRMKKKDQDMHILVEYFRKEPVWNYQKKVRIA